LRGYSPISQLHGGNFLLEPSWGSRKSLSVRGSFKLVIISKKRRTIMITMENYINFLIGGAFMVVISFIITLFMVRHAKKQIKSKE
jgi:hypothetical protein